MAKRCAYGPYSQENCIYAEIEETTVKVATDLEKPIEEWMDQYAINVYCCHPKLKAKRFVNFMTVPDEYIEPKFLCPMDVKEPEVKGIRKIWANFKNFLFQPKDQG